MNAWVSGSAYTSTDQLRLLFRRPLYDFNHSNDTADFPLQWDRLLLYKTVFDLGDLYGIPIEERQLMIEKAKAAYVDIKPSLNNKTNKVHNKVTFF